MKWHEHLGYTQMKRLRLREVLWQLSKTMLSDWLDGLRKLGSRGDGVTRPPNSVPFFSSLNWHGSMCSDHDSFVLMLKCGRGCRGVVCTETSWKWSARKPQAASDRECAPFFFLSTGNNRAVDVCTVRQNFLLMLKIGAIHIMFPSLYYRDKQIDVTLNYRQLQ